MRLVHLADLHLGYRQFSRLTKEGRNQREQDVSDTFASVVDLVCDLKPDLILVAGDTFHTVRPSNQTLLDAMTGFQRLAFKAPITIISGNHEDRQNTETGCVLPILERLGNIWVRWKKIDGNSIVCVPERCASPTANWPLGDFLLLHGEVAGALPINTPNAIPRERFQAEQWQYIALGHYHVRTDIWPNGGYAGSIDYTSSDIWSEARSGVPKGFIEYDTETKQRFFYHTKTRPVFDLPAIDAEGWTFPKIEAALVAAAEFNGLPDGAIIRQRVINLSRPEWKGKDFKAVKKAGSRFLTFQLHPEWQKGERFTSTAKERKATLETTVETFFRTRQFSPEVSLDKLVELGLQYLRESTPTVETSE